MKKANKLTALLTSAAMALTLGVMPAATAMAADYEYGDVNMDGKVSIVDVIMLNKAIMGSETLNEAQKVLADVNADGSRTADDSLQILKHLVKLIDKLGPDEDPVLPTEPETTESSAEETTTTEGEETTTASEDPTEPETTESKAEETTTESETTESKAEETTTESETTESKAEETTTESETTESKAEETTTESETTESKVEETTTESETTESKVEETTTESETTESKTEETTTESETTESKAEETTTESETTASETEETTTESETTASETEETTTEGLTGVTEVRELTTDADGNKNLDLSNATKVEITITGGEAGANVNGTFSYSDPTTYDWMTPSWNIALDADGNGTAYFTVPEGVKSVRFNTWYYGLGDATYDATTLNYTFTVERDPATVLVGETEVRELTTDAEGHSNLDVSGAARVEIAITGGEAGANVNGTFSYSDPTTYDWMTPSWNIALDADGNGTAYFTVPEGVESVRFNTWYYGLGDATYDATTLNYTFTVELAEEAAE